MARINKGNDLTTKQLQPGWSVQSDGFGLNTCAATFKVDTASAPATNVRGQAFPVEAYNYLKAHKASFTYDALGIITMHVDYVGIDPSVGSGVMTNPNTSVANGLTSENITAHPNFFVHREGYDEAIAGPAPYTQDSVNNLAPTVNGAPAWLGFNGSCFERENGGRFIGFVDPTYPQYYGKTQYLAATTTYSGILYTNSQSYVQALFALLNTATSTRNWGVFFLIPEYGPIGVGILGGNQNLLSQVKVEMFGNLFKVIYEIRYSKVGWDKDVYINLSSE